MRTSIDPEEIRITLRCGRPRCSCMKPGPTGPTHCPAHHDEHPSLDITVRDGRVLLVCRAGCPQDAVLSELRTRGLWPGKIEGPPPRPPRSRSTTIYQIRDANGRIVALHEREDGPRGKRFTWRLPDGTLGLGGMRTEDLPLYGVHDLGNAETVVVVEGEKARDALTSAGITAVGSVTGASGTPSHESLRPLAGRRVILWPDADDVGLAHMERIAVRLHALGCMDLRVVTWDAAPPGGDAADLLALEGVEAVRAAITSARPWIPPQVAETADLLDRVKAFVQKYVVLGEHEAVAVALWVLHTYAIDAADVTPYLHITSAVKRSGKTRLLEVLKLLVRTPRMASSATVAALVRMIDRLSPTLLLDELDAALGKGKEYSEALRAILNAGNRRGGVASICVGKGSELVERDFRVFCPKALAGIGDLPDTVADRSIQIVLKRRAPGEAVARFFEGDANQEAAPLRQELEAWAHRAIPLLCQARPEDLPGLGDRAAEHWRPLLAIADMAGQPWAGAARMAARALGEASEGAAEDVRELLLRAIWAIFKEKGDRISTLDLLRALVEREGEPWGEWWGRQVDVGDIRAPAGRLARLLKPFGVSPTLIRGDGVGPVRGYKLQDFQGVFERYLGGGGAEALDLGGAGNASDPGLEEDEEALEAMERWGIQYETWPGPDGPPP